MEKKEEMGNKSKKKLHKKIKDFIKFSKKPIFINKSNTLSKKGILKRLFLEKLMYKTAKGLYAYNGVVYKLIDQFDAIFIEKFNKFKVLDTQYPITVSRGVLLKAGYLGNMLERVELIAHIKNFRGDIPRFRSPILSREKKLISNLALLPSACLPCYEQLKGANLDKDLIALTTKNIVFRNEENYENIFVMNEFRMREFVFFGNENEVKDALKQSVKIVKQIAKYFDFNFTLTQSSDLFYDTDFLPKTLFQLLNKSKLELRVFSYDLNKFVPITSINFHGTHFANNFEIKIKGKCAYTGCVAFGLERWVLSFLNMYGINMNIWPKRIGKILNYNKPSHIIKL